MVVIECGHHPFLSRSLSFFTGSLFIGDDAEETALELDVQDVPALLVLSADREVLAAHVSCLFVCPR